MMRREDIGPASERVRKPHFNIHSPELLVCPYNTNHRVQKHRMPRHLVKCREEYGPSGIDICPYNFVHHIPSDKMKEHLENCFDKIRACTGINPANNSGDDDEWQ